MDLGRAGAAADAANAGQASGQEDDDDADVYHDNDNHNNHIVYSNDRCVDAPNSHPHQLPVFSLLAASRFPVLALFSRHVLQRWL